MNRSIRLASCLILILGLAALVLTWSPAIASGGPDDDAKTLIKLDDDWSRAAAKRDIDLIVSFYAEDGNAYPPNEPAAIGKAAARKVWAAYLSEPSFKISWKTTKAEVSGDMGYTVGTYEDSFDGPDGKTVHERGKYLCIWKKQKDGSWKAIQDMWNADSK
jgi:ketosteroid isomerase-like protein